MGLDGITGARVQLYARYSFKVGYADYGLASQYADSVTMTHFPTKRDLQPERAVLTRRSEPNHFVS